ncbi:NADP-dependent oxidoreductase [Aeromicrobium sp. Sec7.5]|uniref:NADP-dependent oxidoreductase n=1 Tax=Aeromicrobium sp. Sec7.5 TaxID=3121276 RepID=UPI002FE435AB
MSTMRAAAIDAFGPADALTARDVEVPVPGPGEVLVRVLAAGVQITDAAIRGGWTPPGATIMFPQILGNEFAGVIENVGPDVTGWSLGDEAAGFRVLGCYAELVAVPATQIVRKPAGVPWEAAGVLSASGQTAHTAVDVLGISAGETVLVHGAAGGVGTVFVQLAVVRGAQVIGTASAENHEYVRGLGAVPVEYGPGQLERIRAVTTAPVDVAFDAAGHDNLRSAVQVVADRDRIATIVDMALAQELGCRVIRSDRSAARLQDLMDRVDDGTLRIHVRRTYDLDEAAAAHRDVESGHGRGKIALTTGQTR